MSVPRVVSREEWLAARKQLLAREKALTRKRDAVNAERRRLPVVEVGKQYNFEGPAGKGKPAGLVRRPSPADHLPLHVGGGTWTQAAPAAPSWLTTSGIWRTCTPLAPRWRLSRAAHGRR